MEIKNIEIKKPPLEGPPRTQLPREAADQDTGWCRWESSRARSLFPSNAPMSPPPLPQFTASSRPGISSLPWHLVHLAGGHHHQGLRDEFLLSFKICVMFPGEISCSHAKVCAFVLIPATGKPKAAQATLAYT